MIHSNKTDASNDLTPKAPDNLHRFVNRLTKALDVQSETNSQAQAQRTAIYNALKTHLEYDKSVRKELLNQHANSHRNNKKKIIGFTAGGGALGTTGAVAVIHGQSTRSHNDVAHLLESANQTRREEIFQNQNATDNDVAHLLDSANQTRPEKIFQNQNAVGNDFAHLIESASQTQREEIFQNQNVADQERFSNISASLRPPIDKEVTGSVLPDLPFVEQKDSDTVLAKHCTECSNQAHMTTYLGSAMLGASAVTLGMAAGYGIKEWMSAHRKKQETAQISAFLKEDHHSIVELINVLLPLHIEEKLGTKNLNESQLNRVIKKEYELLIKNLAKNGKDKDLPHRIYDLLLPDTSSNVEHDLNVRECLGALEKTIIQSKGLDVFLNKLKGLLQNVEHDLANQNSKDSSTAFHAAINRFALFSPNAISELKHENATNNRMNAPK